MGSTYHKNLIVTQKPRRNSEKAAADRALGPDLNLPMALDDMSNTVDEAYAALPDRLYVVDTEGVVS